MKGTRKSRRISGKNLLMAAFLVAALILGSLMLKKYLASHSPSPIPSSRTVEETASVSLFFASPDTGALVRETRNIRACGGELSVCVREILEELANGPIGDLAPTLPSNSIFRSVTINGDTAVINVGKEFIEGLPQGSSAEITAAYSIVNTVSLNFPAIKRVKFQVEGLDATTFRGHLDLRQPLEPDFKLEEMRG